jgi:membrane-bound serine protease (ClpP class)
LREGRFANLDSAAHSIPVTVSAMSYEFLAILLLVVGCGLIVAEIFIPSGGMILLLCILSFTSAVWCAYMAWWESSPPLFWSYIGATVILIPTVVIGMFRVLSNSSVGDRILLAAPELTEVTPHQEELDRLSALIGERGQALTMLTPGGMVSIAGERLHGFTEGMMLQPGDAVEVVEVRGTRVLVRPAKDTPSPTQIAAVEESDEPGEAIAPLDFDVPQG